MIYSDEGKEIVEVAIQQGNEMTFWFLIIALSLLFTGVLLVVIWLFYKVLYGILLKRLKENYTELRKLEV